VEVYVTRHGLTPLNKENKVNGEVDEPLAPEGVDQARSLTIFPSITHIYTSPLLRTRQTAQIINAQHNLPLIVEEGLTEIRMGSLAGKSWEEMENGLELKKKHRSVQYDYRTYGGESVEQVRKRLLKVFKKINNTYKNHEVLIVTHGGIIRFMHFLEQRTVIEDTVKNASIYTYNLDKILKSTFP